MVKYGNLIGVARKHIKSFLKSRIGFLLLYIGFLALSLAHYYTSGCIILGPEANYVLDFSNHLREESFVWSSKNGIGIPNMSPSGNALNIIFLCLIEKLSGSVPLTNFILIFSMYLVCNELKATPLLSFLVSFFYVINPFILNKKYTGMDPVLWNTNKPFLTFHHQLNLLYDNLASEKLTHSATSPNAYHWGIRAVPPKAGEHSKKVGLSLSVSTLSISRMNQTNIENKPQCLPRTECSARGAIGVYECVDKIFGFIQYRENYY